MSKKSKYVCSKIVWVLENRLKIYLIRPFGNPGTIRDIMEDTSFLAHGVLLFIVYLWKNV